MIGFPFFRISRLFSPTAEGAPADPPADLPAEEPADPPTDPPASPAEEPADPPTDPPAETTPETPPPAPDAQALTQRLMDAELRAAAALAGVPAARIPYAVRMAQVAGADAPDADMAKLCGDAIGRVLTDVPELRGGAGVTVGAQPRTLPAPPKPDYASMSDADYYAAMAAQKRSAK